MPELRRKICTLMSDALADKQHVDSIFFPLSQRAIEEIGKVVYRSQLKKYKFEINSHGVRHTKYQHPNDIEYICEIPKIVKEFTKVRLSLTKDENTGKSIQSIEFYKKYGTKEIKLVKVDLLKEKVLRLKTIFVKD